MLTGKKICLLYAALCVAFLLSVTVRMDVQASTRKECLDSMNAGISQIINPTSGAADEDALAELTRMSEMNAAGKVEESDLVMVNVQVAMNVRAEASEESDKVGVLYKDCGGRILERKDGWTRLKSGDLVGWASDDYLLFGKEAETMADDVGNLIVTIETETLRVRKEPSADAEVIGLMTQDDELYIIEVLDDNWISVEYDDDVGYVSSEFVNIDFHIDEGETLAAIAKREEEERKAKLTANQGAVVVGGDDTKLLAALIYCEAGNESYNGQLAVGAVVMNRVRSGAYPNTISGVIYASGQFPPALNGKVARAYTNNVMSQSCYQAAQAAINGEALRTLEERETGKESSSIIRYSGRGFFLPYGRIYSKIKEQCTDRVSAWKSAQRRSAAKARIRKGEKHGSRSRYQYDSHMAGAFGCAGGDRTDHDGPYNDLVCGRSACGDGRIRVRSADLAPGSSVSDRVGSFAVLYQTDRSEIFQQRPCQNKRGKSCGPAGDCDQRDR